VQVYIELLHYSIDVTPQPYETTASGYSMDDGYTNDGDYGTGEDYSTLDSSYSSSYVGGDSLGSSGDSYSASGDQYSSGSNSYDYDTVGGDDYGGGMDSGIGSGKLPCVLVMLSGDNLM